MDLKEWQLDAGLLAVESITGDLVGAYAVPYLEHKFVGNQNLEKFIQWGMPPALVAGQHALIKKTMTDSNQPVTTDQVLGASVKFVADSAVNMYFPNL